MPKSFDAAFHCLHTALALRCSAKGRKRKNNLEGMLLIPTLDGAADVAKELMPRLVTALMMSMGFSVSAFAVFVFENAPKNFLTPFWMGARAVRWILCGRVR